MDMQETKPQKGWTLIEVLSVCVLISIILSFALPSYMQARKVTYEDNAISRLQRIAFAETRYYNEYSRFGNFTELVEASYLPRGYSTYFELSKDIMSDSSILPFIDRYSLSFNIPASVNSLYYKVDAIPVGYNRMGLRTFNINLFITGSTNPDNILQNPPVREGLDSNGPIVMNY
jgi:prepilin-type N-terminal cleavage/methylation domain-containing protein